MEAGPGRGTFSVRSPCKKGARRRDTLRKKGAVRGQIGRELVSPHPPPASLPFHLHNHPLRSVLVSHPLWGEETEAQGGYGTVHRHSWSV